MNILNPFWKHAFYYIDYQAYVFQGMMVNEFDQRIYSCNRVAGQFSCQFPCASISVGKVEEKDVLAQYTITMDGQGEGIGIMIAITVGYRVLCYFALHLKRR